MPIFQRILVTLLVSCMISTAYPAKTADLIVFSFHRPMQLYALLESVTKYITNLNKISILYRADTADYETAYQEIHARFPQMQFVKQGLRPREDFKPLLLNCLFGSSAEYVMFAVDDDMVKDYVDMNTCIQALEATSAYAFYLRLGTHVHRYYKNVQYALPPSQQIQPGIGMYYFNQAAGDWAYPHNLDMTLFKKSKIERFYKNADYSSPNTLEGAWSGAADLNQSGLFFMTSKKFTLPLNIVQQDWWCQNENSFSVEELFMKWKNGLKIDINPFDKVNNDCVFMGYYPQFIARS